MPAQNRYSDRTEPPGSWGGVSPLFDLFPVLVPGVDLVAAGHREARRPQVFEALVVVELGGVARFGFENGAGGEAAEDVQPARPCRGPRTRCRSGGARTTRRGRCRSPVPVIWVRATRMSRPAISARKSREITVSRGSFEYTRSSSISMSVGRIHGEDARDRAAHEQLRTLVADQVARVLRRLGALQRAFAIRAAPRITAVGVEDDARVVDEHAAIGVTAAGRPRRACRAAA